MNSVTLANIDIATALIRTAAAARSALADAVPAAHSKAGAPASNPVAPAQAADSSVSATTAASTTDAEATLTAILARIVQRAPGTTTTSSAQTPAAGAAIILTEWLNPTHDAAPMDLNLNQLLNSALSQQTLAQKVLAQLPPELLAKPQVIEALVLQNLLLPAADTEGARQQLPLLQLPLANTGAAAATTDTLYRIDVQWQGRVLKLLSSEPLPTGQRVPLQITARGEIVLLSPARAAATSAQQSALANTVATRTPAQPAASPLSSSSTSPPPSLSSLSPPSPTASAAAVQTLQQSVREWLPRQQPLHTLVPQLKKFIEPAVRERLPQPVVKALGQLLQTLPKPAQVDTAENLKQTLNNSGSFFEARLARALTSAPATAEPLPQIFAGDLKAQIGALLAIIRKFAPDTPTQTAPSNTDNEFIYAAKPSPPQAAPHGMPSSDPHALDALLTQLSKLLQAGFARIQLNQLDSASARHVSHETQTPVPTWVLELPLRTPHGVDQLQLRIEQRHKRHQQRTRVQWNVEIAFDLHAAGKLAATLAIVDKNVSATLWAERAQTHRQVREEMGYLRAGLESVGVRVTEMQCRHGLPTPRSRLISQQLVDVHT